MKTVIETDKVFVVGENVDTDQIIPARYLVTTDPAVLGKHCLEDVIENLAEKTDGNGIIVGGRNFGSGSSREHAPVALLGAGVRCVIAPSFARIFFRNAFNVGLPLLSCPEIDGQISEGENLRVDIEAGTVEKVGPGKVISAEAIDPFMIDLLQAGGLVNLVQARLKLEGEN